MSLAVVPFSSRALTVRAPSVSAEGIDDDAENSGALVPVTSLSQTVLCCPMCHRPFGPSARAHHIRGEDNEEDVAVAQRSSAGFLENGLLTSQYFRSLPPIQDENDVASIPSTPITDAPRIASTQPSAQETAFCSGEQEEENEQRLAASGYYASHFAEVHRIGGGTFGAVFLCRHVMEGQTLGLFAVKKIPIGDDPAYFCKVLREVRVMEEIKRHPNVLEYHHSWIDYAKTADFGPTVRCLFVLMEFASEGSLDDYLRVHGGALSNVAVWYFFLSAVAGIAHLHGKGILHRDVKPQNLLLTRSEAISSTTTAPPRLLVADFGTAALLSDVHLSDRTGGTGTQEYMAPELFDVEAPTPPSTAEQYLFTTSRASDVWSLGMILHYLACDGMLPPTLADGSVILNIDEHSPVQRPPEMVELVRAMLQRDPSKRPTCGDILSATAVQKMIRAFEREDFVDHELRSSTNARMASSTNSFSRRSTSPTPSRALSMTFQNSRSLLRKISAETQTDVGGSDWELFEAWRKNQSTS